MKFNRRNIFARDNNQCQYCGKRFSTAELSLDHVVPRSQGGVSTWDNIVYACLNCNVRKGGRTPQQAHMHPLVRPIRPTSWQLHQQGKSFPPNYLHETWRDWLYWDIELEE